MPDRPQLLFVAGPNGAGKSTFSERLSSPGAMIFDVDKVIPRIATQLPQMPKKQIYLAATQEFFDLATQAINRKQHFTLETSFRDEQLVDIVATFKRYGYETNLVYLTLDGTKQSTNRVSERVSNGGHYVDEKNILLNYSEGLEQLERLADRFDNLDILDASKGNHELISLLKVEQGRLVHLTENLPSHLAQIIANVAGLFRNNPRDYSPGR